MEVSERNALLREIIRLVLKYLFMQHFSSNKKILFIVLLAFLNINAFSQSYFTAGGVRLGTDWGITFQQRLLKHTTGEAIFQSSLFREELMLTALFEQHYPVISKRLNVYLGAGFHKGYLTNNNSTFQAPFGISAIGGIEFTIARFAISYDYKPAFNLSGGENTWYSQSGISVRYVFIKQNLFKKIKRKRKRKKRKNKRIERREQIFKSK